MSRLYKTWDRNSLMPNANPHDWQIDQLCKWDGNLWIIHGTCIVWLVVCRTITPWHLPIAIIGGGRGNKEIRTHPWVCRGGRRGNLPNANAGSIAFSSWTARKIKASHWTISSCKFVSDAESNTFLAWNLKLKLGRTCLTEMLTLWVYGIMSAESLIVNCSLVSRAKGPFACASTRWSMAPQNFTAKTHFRI